jgi:hypothetical protein
MNDLLKEFAKLKIEEKIINDKIDLIKQEAYDTMFEMGLSRETPIDVAGFGRFTYGNRITYTFSKEVESEEKKLDQMRLDEIRLGTAKAKDSLYAKFKAE